MKLTLVARSFLVCRLSTRCATLAVLILCAACANDVTGPSDQFMIRRPVDSLLGGAPSFAASATGTNSLDFQWEPVSRADSYSIVFTATASTDSMNTLQGDLSNPTLTFAVSNTATEEVLVNPSGDPDGLRVRVVTHSITSAEMHAALTAAGVTAGSSINTIYAVLAHRGSQSIRSLEVQRLVLRLQ